MIDGSTEDHSAKDWLQRQLDTLESSLPFRFITHYEASETDLLASLCDRYGSDKGSLKDSGHVYSWPPHNYTDYYSRIFSHCRQNVKRVFECGIGTDNPGIVANMGVTGNPGASLRVWRDYFPNATVYGGDIDRNVLFEEDRIKTFYMDQLDPESIEHYWRQVEVSDFDLMIDDGLHSFDSGACLFKYSVSKLASAGLYIIEDVRPDDLVRYREYFRSINDYSVDYITMFRPGLALLDNSLIIIRHPG